MSKIAKYIVFFVGILVFIGGMILINNFLNESVKNVNKEKLSSSNDRMEENVVEIIEVTENNFEKEVLQSNKKVLVDFYADWCGPCKMMSPILEEIAKENNDIKIVKVNVDYNYDLSMEYGAMSIPLFIAFENGEELDRIVGAVNKAYLLEMFK